LKTLCWNVWICWSVLRRYASWMRILTLNLIHKLYRCRISKFRLNSILQLVVYKFSAHYFTSHSVQFLLNSRASQTGSTRSALMTSDIVINGSSISEELKFQFFLFGPQHQSWKIVLHRKFFCSCICIKSIYGIILVWIICLFFITNSI